QVLPQLIWVGLAGLELEVTVPLPTPRGLAFWTARVNLCRVKVAVTDLAALMVTVQVAPETESHPLQLVKLDPVAGAAVRVTEVAPVKLVPLIVTLVPTGPLAGAKLAIAGGGTTVNALALVAVPPGVVTLSCPVLAPAGTVAWIAVSEVTVKLALAVLNFIA